MVGHVMGLPIEESVLALASAGAATVTAVAIAGRAGLGRLRHLLPTGRVFRGSLATGTWPPWRTALTRKRRP